MGWSQELFARTREEFAAAADPDRGPAMAAYMKGVAPFLGIGTPDRRRAQRAAWRELPPPDRRELLAAADELAHQDHREFHYAAVELLGRHLAVLQPEDLDGAVRPLMLLRPWWDSVDLCGSAVITPAVAAHPDLVGVMWAWNGQRDQWLIRASVQHQRGLGAATDAARLIGMCEPHVHDSRFFVAKAVGWALRDLARVEPGEVQGFLARHPQLPAVARREACRGLERASRSTGLPAVGLPPGKGGSGR
jgi:3-methyladenine DNA glycosylase AlkD